MTIQCTGFVGIPHIDAQALFLQRSNDAYSLVGSLVGSPINSEDLHIKIRSAMENVGFSRIAVVCNVVNW